MIADVKFHGDRRKIAAFIGGLDLCGGRYDTPGHRLYNDLDTVFKDDNYNPAFSVSNCFVYTALYVHIPIAGTLLHTILNSVLKILHLVLHLPMET